MDSSWPVAGRLELDTPELVDLPMIVIDWTRIEGSFLLTCSSNDGPGDELELETEMRKWGQEEEGVYCRTIHWEAERGGSSSRAGEHMGAVSRELGVTEQT